jgi:hypothetical protein
MSMTAPWARYDPRIQLYINGMEMPCVRCSVDYELNAIPQATATIAVGRDFTGKPSPAHDLIKNFVDRAPAAIYFRPYVMGIPTNSGTQPGQFNLEREGHLIFEGYVTAAGFTRSRGGAQFNVQMEHWLSELGFSSIFSKSSHPTNPGDYSFGSMGPMGGAGGAFANLGLAFDFVTSEHITNDFWGEALKPFLLKLCEKDAFYASDPYIEGSGANDGAKNAIERIGGKQQMKLALDVDGADVDIVSNIMNHVSAAVGTAGPLANQTMWDVLIGTFCSQYLFSLVPRISDAVIVPFIAGYRKSYLTISADEETQVEWTRGLGRPLRGVGVLCNAESSTGATKKGQPAPAALGIGGFYSPDDKAQGIIIIKEGPGWMNRLYSPALYAHGSVGSDGKPIGTAVHPGGEKKADVPDAVATRLKETIRPFLGKYAQALYALEKLRTRQAVCSGPFRLDIAPGATVRVENEGEQHITDDPFSAPFYAHVARVSLAIDGEQPSIGTSFHLSHIRSEAENEDDKTSIDSHPLYKETFLGCGLFDLKD